MNVDKFWFNHIPALDGLRAVSILLVVISHAWLGHIVPGGLGVTIFFFISGFIITTLMINEYHLTGGVSIIAFYLRRFFRIVPALVCYISFSLVFMIAINKWSQINELWAALFYYANYYAIFFGFSGGHFPSPLTITWSLSVEEHYYFFFPCLFALFFSRRKEFVLFLFSLLIIILLWRIYLVYHVGVESLAHDRIYKGTDTRFDSILYGALLAIMVRYGNLYSILSNKLFFFAGLLILLMTLVIRDNNFRESLRYSLQGVAITIMFVHMIFSDANYLRFLKSRFFVFIGKISYSLYLYHWLMFGLVSYYMATQPLVLKIVVMISTSIFLATLSFRYIERPVLSYYRNKIHKNVPVAVGA